MHPRDIEQDTKLSTVEQIARARAAQQWARRILAVVTEAACSVRLALQAIEDADQPQQTRRRQ